MRFHIGFSFRPALSWIKWILLGITALLCFFGIGNHVVLAETLSAVPNNVYVKSPQVDQEYAYAGDLINAETGTPYSANWDGETYYAFQTISSPYTSLGRGDNIRGARLRWTYPTAQMNKCSNGQSITYVFEFYLRKLYSSGTEWNKGFNGISNHDVWIRSSSQNYDCTVSAVSEKTMKATCTMPNPTSNVYFYLDNFSIPVVGWYQTNSNNMYYNVGVRSVTYTCTGVDSGAIINNQNQNTNTIINNNNQNTQQIVDSQNEINNNITDDTIDQSTTGAGHTFFDTFETSSTTGLTGILTAPLRLFQNMINSGTCEPLNIRLNMADDNLSANSFLSLPCGSILWNKAPNEVVYFYHTLIFGLVGYRLLIDMVKFINNTLNPEHTDEYVMEL